METAWRRTPRSRSLLDEYCSRIGAVVPRHRAEVALRAAKDAAETANRAKSEFLAHISHELRTPLNAIIGFSDVIRNNLLGSDAQDRYCGYADDIFRSGEHLLSIINDILDLTKHDVGKIELYCEDVDIRQLVTDCVKLFRDTANKQKVNLKAELDAELPHLYADKKRLKQILINLTSNAIKFTQEHGNVEIEARSTAVGNIILSVRDSGIGMKPEDIPVALQPFRQIEHYLTRQHEGTGLGLPIAKIFSDLHDAELTVTSQRGVGTHIMIEFPASRARRHGNDGATEQVGLGSPNSA